MMYIVPIRKEAYKDPNQHLLCDFTKLSIAYDLDLSTELSKITVSGYSFVAFS